MRISDWSSDVCSSDLIWHQATVAPLVRDEPKELKAARGRAVGPVVNAMLRDLCAAYALLDSVSSLIGRKVLTGESWRCDDRKSCHGDRQTGCRHKKTPQGQMRSEEHTSELQSLMRISYAVFCLKKKTTTKKTNIHSQKIFNT